MVLIIREITGSQVWTSVYEKILLKLHSVKRKSQELIHTFRIEGRSYRVSACLRSCW